MKQKRVAVWVAGLIIMETGGAFLIKETATGKAFWVPRYSVGNIRPNRDRGAGYVFFINKWFPGVKKFKALDRKTIQRLLGNDAV